MTLNLGFIGVGGIAEVHLRNIAGFDDARVASVFDVNADRADAIAAKYESKAYHDLQHMLDGEKLDGVYICVPPFAHGDSELEVIKRGLPMLVEKPLGVADEPVQQILQLVESNGLLTSVGYHWRYSEATNRARQSLAGKVPGMALGYWLGGMPGVAWWRNKDGSGGQFVEQTTHIVDLARYLLGEVTEVYAAYSNRQMHELVENTTVPDVGSVTLKFANGAIGTITNTCLLDQGYTVGLDILTRDVIVEVRGDSVTERLKSESTVYRNQTNPYQVEDRAFLDAIRTGDASLVKSSYADASRTHRVTMAANESASIGQPIRL